MSATVGAYLAAYMDLPPTLSTLRLCNRYGNRDSTFLTYISIKLLISI